MFLNPEKAQATTTYETDFGFILVYTNTTRQEILQDVEVYTIVGKGRYELVVSLVACEPSEVEETLKECLEDRENDISDAKALMAHLKSNHYAGWVLRDRP